MFRDDNRMELRFGSVVLVIMQMKKLFLNPDNVGSSLGQGVSRLDESFDPSNFLKTQTFGLAPSNNYFDGGL